MDSQNDARRASTSVPQVGSPKPTPSISVDPLGDIEMADNILAELEAFGSGGAAKKSFGGASGPGAGRPASMSVAALNEVDQLLAQIDGPGGLSLDDLDFSTLDANA